MAVRVAPSWELTLEVAMYGRSRIAHDPIRTGELRLRRTDDFISARDC